MLAETGGCACLNLRMAARAVTQMFDAHLKPSGLKATQFSILAEVAVGGPASMTALAEALVMDRTTLTRNLKPLSDREWVRTSMGGDRRQRTVELTAKGQIVLARALPLWMKAQNKVVRGLGFARWHGAAGLLEEAVRITR